MKRHALMFLVLVCALAALAATAASPAKAAYSCGDINYTNQTSYGSGEKIVVDVWGEGFVIPSGLSVGGQQWYRASYTNYGDHTSTIFKPQITQARGTYNVHVSLGGGGFLCTNPDGQFHII